MKFPIEITTMKTLWILQGTVCEGILPGDVSTLVLAVGRDL